MPNTFYLSESLAAPPGHSAGRLGRIKRGISERNIRCYIRALGRNRRASPFPPRHLSLETWRSENSAREKGATKPDFF